MAGRGTPVRCAGLGRLTRYVVVVCAVATGGACGGDKEATQEPSKRSRADAGAVQMSSLYAPTAKGLAKMIRHILTDVKNGNARADRLITSFSLPDHTAWFTRTFGAEKGAIAARQYAPLAVQITQMKKLFRTLIAANQTEINVERFEHPGSLAAIGYQSLTLNLMKQRTPLYSVRLVKPGNSSGFHLWSFVYDRSGFRWIGRMSTLAAPTPVGTLDRNLLRVRDANQLAN